MNAAGNAFGRVCLSVCPVRALTFENLDTETLFMRAGTSSEYLARMRMSRSSAPFQGHRSKTRIYERSS